jgi:hypothetical protein
MALLDQSIAHELLAPHFPQLYDIPHESWDEIHRRIPQDLLVVFDGRTRANAMHDLITAKAGKYAECNGNTKIVRTFERQQMRGIVIADAMALRTKKFNESCDSCRSHTKQVAEFRQQIPLTGLGAIHNLEWGYILNETETEIADIFVICPSGIRSKYWSMRINGSGAAFDTVDIFTSPVPPTPTPPKIGPKKNAIVVPIRKEET